LIHQEKSEWKFWISRILENFLANLRKFEKKSQQAKHVVTFQTCWLGKYAATLSLKGRQWDDGRFSGLLG
jgi:hypothetical protein